MSGLDNMANPDGGYERLGGGNWAKDEDRSYGNKGNQTYDEWMQSKGYAKGSYGHNDGYLEWRQANTPEDESFTYLGTEYKGTGKVKPKEAESVSESNKETITEGTDYSWVLGSPETTEAVATDSTSKDVDKSTESGYDTDLYLYAKGMLEGNKTDDFGEPIGWYGNIETPKSKKKTAEEQLAKTNKNSAKYQKLTDEIAGYDKAIDAFQKYVDAYKDEYEKDTNKSKYETYGKADWSEKENAEKEYYDAEDKLEETQRNFYSYLQTLGITDDYDYNDPESMSRLYDELTKTAVEAQDFANNDSINKAVDNGALTGKYYSQKGYGVTIEWDATGLKNLFSGGSKLGTATIGNKTYDIVRTDSGELGDASIRTDEKGTPQVELSGFSTNAGEDKAHQDAIPVAIVNITNKVAEDALNRGAENVETNENVKNAYNNAQAFWIQVKTRANEANAAQENVNKLEENLNKVTRTSVDTIQKKADQLAKQTLDAYTAGEISAFEAANKLSNIENTKIRFSMDDITSKIDPEKDVLGKIGRGDVVSRAGIELELSDTGSSGVKSMISKLESLVELRKAVDEIDTTKIENPDQAQEAVATTQMIASKYATVANSDLKSMVTEMLKTGADLQEIRKNPKFRELSQQIFTDAQAIYDKVSEIEATTEKYGLNGLTKKEIEAGKNVIQAQVNRLAGNPDYKITLDEKGVEALAEYSSSIESTKDAALALMKSAAFNGAENVQGGKYSEEWKAQPNLKTNTDVKLSYKDVMDKDQLTWSDWFSSAARGTAGAVATALGAAIAVANPALGAVLIAAGTSTIAKTGADVGMNLARSKSTNAEVMFENSESDWKNVFNDIYNRAENPANVGDPTAVGTYTNMASGAIEVSQGFVNLIINPAEGLMLISDGIEKIHKVATGGLSGNLDTTIQNVYDLGKTITEYSKMDGVNVDDWMQNPKDMPAGLVGIDKDPKDWQSEETTKNGKPITKDAEADYSVDFGTITEVSDDPNSTIDDKYSGYKEQAKNSNIAKNYNYGMEQDVNEVVSDKDVKGYIVTLYSKEPKWMRKAIDKVLSAHSEREW